MRKLLLIFSFCGLLFANDATTTILNQGISLPKIVVQDASNLSDANLQNQFFKLMVGDLKVGATFEVDDAYYQSSYDGDYTTNIGSSALIVRYEVTGSRSSAMELKTKVIDARNGSILYESKFDISSGEKFPFLAHKAVSEIVKQLGYSNVDWMNEMLVYSVYTSSADSSIYIADYTLTYQKRVVSGGLNIFPKWTSDAQNEFYYTFYENDINPTIYKYNLSNGSKRRVLSGSGMLTVSDVSEDGSRLLITDAPNDQPDIYLYSIKSGSKTKVTDYPGIDVSGKFIDGDSRVVFVSDRLGYPNIFSTGINGGGIEQMVYHGRNNNSIDASGSYVVYSSREQNRDFNLYLISTQTDYIRQLTNGGKNLYPRFSSDGGSVIFIKDSGYQSAVGIIRINENKSFQFPLKIGKLQSLDW
ncbi:MAG: Tol-Pal system protein TolB [Campylobacteraceae bacterium]|nr:Tol-Pal system protein TolB [Campylobacteraceae bacterium]